MFEFVGQGVPPPERVLKARREGTQRGADMQAIHGMTVDDMLVTSDPARVTVAMRRLGYKAATQKQPDGTYRVWRIA